MFKSRIGTYTTKDTQDIGSFSVTELLRLFEDQNNLLKNDDRLIERFAAQLSGYEQELCDKDVYIRELKDELRQTLKASNSREVPS